MPTYILTSEGLIDKKTGAVIPRLAPDTPITGFPQIHRGDETEPLVSMADGKTYTSKAAMRESYKAANNPRGQDFIEVGDQKEYLDPTSRPPLAPKKEDFLVAVEKAEAAISRGEFQDVQ